MNISSIPSPGQVIHIAVNESSDQPFMGSEIEEVFATNGQEMGPTSVGVYYDNILAVGSICGNMMVCEVSYLMYQ